MNDPCTPAVSHPLSGRYALEERRGSGGAGVVWRAQDLLLDRTVAVKLLHAEVAADPPAAGRFRAEASMAAKLTHPNAVIVYDIGRDDGRDYLVMEFVEGGTLAHVLAGGPLAPGIVAGLGAQVARALGAAHHRRLVHRDVKPANVLVTTEGDAKVADFGIAQALGSTSSRLTAPGEVMGTARYLAPEQLRGEIIDARADVYALGVVLHEALTGEVPFGEGTTAEVASRRLVASLPRVSEHRSDVPFGLDDAIARATQLDPRDRFVDGRAFATELARSSTPGARRELATRLFAYAPATSHARDGSCVTADLSADVDRPSILPEGPARADEPTAGMTPLVVPPGFAPLASAGSSRGAAIDADSGIGSGSGEPSAPDPTPVRGVEDLEAVPPAASSARPGPPAQRGRDRRPVLALWVGLAVLIGGGGVIAAIDRSDEVSARAGEVAGDDRGADGPDATADAVVDDDDPTEDEDEPLDSEPAEIVAGRDHDPFGSGDEHRADVANAFDGDATTAWQTQGYRGSPELGGLKSGVGIWFDLGDEQQVTELEVAMAASGASFTVFAGSSPPDPGAAPEAWGRAVAEVTGAEARTTLTFDEPTEGRVWLLWFTSLPEDGSVYRATVSEVRLLSS